MKLLNFLLATSIVAFIIATVFTVNKILSSNHRNSPVISQKQGSSQDKLAAKTIKKEPNQPKINNSDQPTNKESSGCDALAKKLELCEPFSCSFIDPSDGVKIMVDIIGLIDGKCECKAVTANDNKMNCNFTESMRKVMAQYITDNPLGKSSANSKQGVAGNSSERKMYVVNGEKTDDPLKEAWLDGQCNFSVIEEFRNQMKEKEGSLEIEWGEFGLRDKTAWESKIRITNYQNEIVYVRALGVGKERNWGWTRTEILEPGFFETLKLNIDLFFFKKVAFDKKKITINAYECSKLPKEITDELCVRYFGYDGILSPREVLEKYEKAGTPIEPTAIYTKYYDYYSLDSPPLEITEEEFLE